MTLGDLRRCLGGVVQRSRADRPIECESPSRRIDGSDRPGPFERERRRLGGSLVGNVQCRLVLPRAVQTSGPCVETICTASAHRGCIVICGRGVSPSALSHMRHAQVNAEVIAGQVLSLGRQLSREPHVVPGRSISESQLGACGGCIIVLKLRAHVVRVRVGLPFRAGQSGLDHRQRGVDRGATEAVGQQVGREHPSAGDGSFSDDKEKDRPTAHALCRLGL